MDDAVVDKSNTVYYVLLLNHQPFDLYSRNFVAYLV